MPYIVGADDRLANMGMVLLAQVIACLTPRCFQYTGLFPGPPDAPCDVLAVYLDPDRPISVDPVFAQDADDKNCAVGQLTANYIVHLQRCCAIPPPEISPDGTKVVNWLNTTAHTAAFVQLSRDLLSVYECLLCTREELFDSCAMLRIEDAQTTLDSCYVHRIKVAIPFDHNCCAAGPC